MFARVLRPGVAGLLWWLSLPPRGGWLLAIAGSAIFTTAIGGHWRDRMSVGFVAGIVWLGPAFFWVVDLSLPGWFVLVVAQSLMFALAVALAAPGRARFVAFPAVMVVFEWLRSRWPLGGLPLGGLALGQVSGPLLPLARYGGSLAVVAAVAAFGGALAGLFDGGQRRPYVAVIGLGIAASTIAGGIDATRGQGEFVRVALVQGGGTLGTHATETDEAEVTRRHLDASARIPNGTDLILWPEDVVDLPIAFAESEAAERIGRIARSSHAWIVVGVIEPVGRDKFTNAAVAIDPAGIISDRYDKVHLVPFGEYIPARELLDDVVDVSRVPRDAVAGSGPGLLHIDATPVGVAISYEAFFSDRTRDAARAGAQLLVIPTNASSFRNPTPAHETLAAARIRAIETGRDTAQAAPTGFSALIDARGRIISRTDLTKQQVIVGTLELHKDRTPYVLLGDTPLVTLAAATLSAAWGIRGLHRLRGRASTRFEPSTAVSDSPTAASAGRGTAERP